MGIANPYSLALKSAAWGEYFRFFIHSSKKERSSGASLSFAYRPLFRPDSSCLRCLTSHAYSVTYS